MPHFSRDDLALQIAAGSAAAQSAPVKLHWSEFAVFVLGRLLGLS